MDRRAFLAVIPGLALIGCASTDTAPQAASSGPRFSDAERKLIIDFYESERALSPKKDKPPQMFKPGDKLVSGSRPYHLPGTLKAKLSPYPLPEPYTRLVVGGDVILVNRDNHDITDVIPQMVY